MASTLPSAGDCCTPCSHTLSVTIVESTGGGGGTQGLVFDTTQDLRDYGTHSDNSFATVLGDVTPGDGNGHQYWWDESGSDADNGASVIRPDDFTSVGVWRQWI